MPTESILYICPVCFKICDTGSECHRHQMVECDVGQLGDEIRRPVKDRFGNYASRAPRWYLEAVNKSYIDRK